MIDKENEKINVTEEVDTLVEHGSITKDTENLDFNDFVGKESEYEEKIESLNNIKDEDPSIGNYRSEDKEDNSEDMGTFDLKNIDKSNIINKIASNSGQIDLSLVFTSDSGTCARISKACLEKLGINIESGVDNKIDFAFVSDGIAISKDFSGSGITCNIKKGRNIYAKGLITEIVQRFNLDYTGVSTRSFSVTKYKKLPNKTLVAVIEM